MTVSGHADGLKAVLAPFAAAAKDFAEAPVRAAIEKAMGARANKDVESRGLDRSQHGEMSYQDLTALM